jgi:hypothetical protein
MFRQFSASRSCPSFSWWSTCPRSRSSTADHSSGHARPVSRGKPWGIFRPHDARENSGGRRAESGCGCSPYAAKLLLAAGDVHARKRADGQPDLPDAGTPSSWCSGLLVVSQRRVASCGFIDRVRCSHSTPVRTYALLFCLTHSLASAAGVPQTMGRRSAGSCSGRSAARVSKKHTRASAGGTPLLG